MQHDPDLRLGGLHEGKHHDQEILDVAEEIWLGIVQSEPVEPHQ